MRGALDVHRFLLERDVPHEVVRVRGAVAASADDLPRALDVPSTSCLAVRCYVTDVGFTAVLVHAGVLPDPTAVLDAVGARTLRAATADEVNRATDYAAGLVSPVGLPSGVHLLADAVLDPRAVVYCPVGEGRVVLGIRVGDLVAAVSAQVLPLSSLPLPRQEPHPWSGRERVIDLEADASRQRPPRR
jgi:Cys-tRNA(Pro)/Cys-tRNA(Cys) deacylase